MESCWIGRGRAVQKVNRLKLVCVVGSRLFHKVCGGESGGGFYGGNDGQVCV